MRGAQYRWRRQLRSIRIKDRIKALLRFTPSPPAHCEYAFVGGWLICVSGSFQAWAALLVALRKTQCRLMRDKARWWTINCRRINERFSSSAGSSSPVILLPLTHEGTSLVATEIFASLKRQQVLRWLASHRWLISQQKIFCIFHIFIGETGCSFFFSKSQSVTLCSEGLFLSWCVSALSPHVLIRVN